MDTHQIKQLLCSIHEHKMASDILVPLLTRIGSFKGVKYTGGSDEEGIDVEYYTLSQPLNKKEYVGIQVKQGDITYSASAKNGSANEAKSQAEAAFEKELFDTATSTKYFITKYVVLATGEINERARKYIGKNQARGGMRNIEFWDGELVAGFINAHWENEFKEYFGVSDKDEENQDDEISEDAIVNAGFINEGYEKEVNFCKKLKRMVSGYEWEILSTVAKMGYNLGCSRISITDFLFEMGSTEDYLSDELNNLVNLDLLNIDEDGIALVGKATSICDLVTKISDELNLADEDTEAATNIFDDLNI